jgi:hypothetical protein
LITFNKLGSYGRFGNQLFQYAALYSIAKTRGYDFGVPYNNRSVDEYNDFCLKDCFSNLSAKNSSNIEQEFFFQPIGFKYNAGIFGIPDDTDICGYFQSEKYFINYKNQILNEYQFNKSIKDEALNIRNITNKPVISIHVRLGDYLQNQTCHPVCSKEYYFEALNILPDDLMLFIFSDDIEKASEIFKNLKRPMVFIDTKNKFVDMCVMSMCNYHIIANSSFSWWGAWLAESKKVIAPSQWFGPDINMPKNWSDIYCKDWIVI